MTKLFARIRNNFCVFKINVYICKRILHARIFMKRHLTLGTLGLLAVLLPACMKVGDLPDGPSSPAAPAQNKISFPVTVTRDGQEIPQEAITKAEVDASDKISTMAKDKPFGLIGIDADNHTLLLDNVSVFNNSSGGYSGFFDKSLWEIPATITFSAYYPYVRDVNYQDSYESYSIPYTVQETEAGPLVSKTVERAIDQLNMIPLEFQHITNDIGFKICDVTPREELQGLIHLRKLTAYHVASAGVYVNDILLSRGNWNYQGYYRDVVVFEGDVPVGVGTAHEQFVGKNALADHMTESRRFHAIPDDIIMGKQYVEVEFDVDGFYIQDEYYEPLHNQVFKYLIYGLLPDNTMIPGKQYTFHIGLDLSSIYRDIGFTATVSDWETKIYENNDDF